MQSLRIESQPTRRTRAQHRAVGYSIALFVCVASLAGCGGGGSGPSVASVSTIAATPTTSGTSAPNALAFAACMRKNGVPAFPDPNSSGIFPLGSLKGLDLTTPTVKSATTACASLRPPGIASAVQQDLPQLLKFSNCMRKNGEPSFPDIGGGSGSRLTVVQEIKALDPTSPRFQSTFSKCRSLLPSNISQYLSGAASSSGGS